MEMRRTGIRIKRKDVEDDKPPPLEKIEIKQEVIQYSEL